MRLFLCEKPSQGATIAKVLGANQRKSGFYEGGGNTVTWCIGHLIEAAPPDAYDQSLKKWSLDALPIVPDQWKMTVCKSTASQFKTVKSLMSKASELIIATDIDRAGEMIAREIVDICRYKGPIKRLWLSALNEPSIRKGLENLKDGNETKSMYFAALARSRADWLIGMNLTRLFTLLGQKAGYQGVLSIGRVQTPTLKLVADRELQVENFVPVPYWNLDVALSSSGSIFLARWQCPDVLADDAGRCVNPSDAEDAKNEILGAGQAVVQSLTKKRRREQPPLPFKLGELQKVCSSKFGLGAQDTLDTVQALYEKFKIVTYPRVSVGFLPANMHQEAPAILQAMVKTDGQIANLVAQADTTIKSSAWNDSKVNAHHGIIPTLQVIDISQLNERERNVYDLIKIRYLAQFFPLHEFDKTDAVFTVAGYFLKASGKKIINPGWQIVMGGSAQDDEEDGSKQGNNTNQELPDLSEGCGYPVMEAGSLINAMHTKAPAFFSEGTLIEAMEHVARYVSDPRLKATLRENTGIGTEATRAGIIENLLKRKLILKKGKRHLIVASEAHDLLAAIPAAISNPGTTAIWEQALDMVESGELSLDSFVDKQSIWIENIIKKYRDPPTNLNVTAKPNSTQKSSRRAVR